MHVVAYVIAHAAFRAERVKHLNEHILPRLDGAMVHVEEDHEGVGSLEVFRRCMAWAMASGATHVAYLCDDAVLPDGFLAAVASVVESRPGDIVCGFPNHAVAPKLYAEGHRWYSTDDGSVVMPGVMPVAVAAEYLRWRDTMLVDPWARHDEGGVRDDEGLNLFAMATGRKVYKTLPALVGHEDFGSLIGNDGHEFRQPAVPPEPGATWGPEEDVPHIGRTYRGNHWKLVTKTVAGPALLSRALELDGGHKPGAPHVMLACPAYGNTLTVGMSEAMTSEAQHLAAHGVAATLHVTSGDSLVQRGRNDIAWHFLKSPATHMLFWDSDVIPRQVGYVADMLRSGHDLVGGAYPFKDDSGRVVTSLLPGEQRERDGFAPVLDLPTGFMLISRRLLLAMARRLWSEMFYLHDAPHCRGEPRLAFFDCGIRAEHGRRYLSEDYLFCRRWQEMGGRAWVMLDADFYHVGPRAYEGSIRSQLA
jgi:hypothetical protein